MPVKPKPIAIGCVTVNSKPWTVPPPPFERRLMLNGQLNRFTPAAVHCRDGEVADCMVKNSVPGRSVMNDLMSL